MLKEYAKICKYCDKEFTTNDYRSNFCSASCRYKAIAKSRRENTKPKKCLVCGKEFKPYHTTDKFCSYECLMVNKKSKSKWNWDDEQCENRRGTKNPAYRNGLRVNGTRLTGKGLKKFKKNAEKIESRMINEYGWKFCEICKVSNAIKYERHHIIFRSEKPNHENLHDKENILITCISCHNKLHANKGMRDAIVKERGLDKIFGSDVLNKTKNDVNNPSKA